MTNPTTTLHGKYTVRELESIIAEMQANTRATRKLPSQWAAEGYFLIEGGYDPKVGDFVDFYNQNQDKCSGQVIEMVDGTITLVDEHTHLHNKFTIKRA